MKKDLGLYIHIPFCVKKCEYCDFLSWNAEEEERQQYVAALLSEIEVTGNLRKDIGYQQYLLGEVRRPFYCQSRWRISFRKFMKYLNWKEERRLP